MSQSPQIGSMFLTQIFSWDLISGLHVAIPSNRVNVSYDENELKQKLAQFPSRNPLKSGQCFLRRLFLHKQVKHII